MKLQSVLQANECNIYDGCSQPRKCTALDGQFKCLPPCNVSSPSNAQQLENWQLQEACLCNGHACSAGDKCIRDSQLYLPGLIKQGTYCLPDCEMSGSVSYLPECLCPRQQWSESTFPAICEAGEACESTASGAQCISACTSSQMNVIANSVKCGCGKTVCDLRQNVCYNKLPGKNGLSVGSQCLPACSHNANVAETCFCDGLCNTGNYCRAGNQCECKINGYGPCQNNFISCSDNTIYNGFTCQRPSNLCAGATLNSYTADDICSCAGDDCEIFEAEACLQNQQTSAVEGCLPICPIGTVTQECGCNGQSTTSYAKAGQKCYADGQVSCPENVILKMECKCSESPCQAGNACYKRAGYVAVCVPECREGNETKAGCICQKGDPNNLAGELFCANNIKGDGKKAFCVERKSLQKPEIIGDYNVCLPDCNAGYVGNSGPCKCENLIKEDQQCPKTRYCAGGAIGNRDSVVCRTPCTNAQVLNRIDECVCRSSYEESNSVCRTGEWCTGMIRGNTDNNAYTYMPNNKGNSACVNALCAEGVVPKEVNLCKIYDDADVFACNYKSYAYKAQQAGHECVKICDHQESGVDDDFGYETGLEKCVCNSQVNSPFFFCLPESGTNVNIYCATMITNPGISDLPVPSVTAECVPGCLEGELADGDYCKCESNQLSPPCAEDTLKLRYCAGGAAVTSSTARCVIPCTDVKASPDGCTCSTAYDRETSVCGINNEAQKPYCTGMDWDANITGEMRPSTAGKCVVLCLAGENRLNEECRCWGSAVRSACESGEFCLEGSPGTTLADLFKYKCEDGIATEKGDTDLDGKLKGCVCNSSNYSDLSISVCRENEYCVGMQQNWPARASHCVQKCPRFGINDSGTKCKCERDRNKPGCPDGYYCIAGEIAVSSACVPVCTASPSPMSNQNLTNGCICNDDFSLKSSICTPGNYCLKMAGTVSAPLPSPDALCVPLCRSEILGEQCKCLPAPQADPCPQGFFCSKPGQADAQCIPPCSDGPAGILGCLCNTTALICPEGKYCIKMNPGPLVGPSGICVDLCQENAAENAPCKCEQSASKGPCDAGRFCVGTAGSDGVCYDECGDNPASAHPNRKCVCKNDLHDTQSLCSESEYCSGMRQNSGKYEPSSLAACYVACQLGPNMSVIPCRCTLNPISPPCHQSEFCVAGRPAIDQSAVCLADECGITPAGVSGCVCSTSYLKPSAACYGGNYCVGLQPDFSHIPSGECVQICALGEVNNACRCLSDVRDSACQPGEFCAGGNPTTTTLCLFACEENKAALSACICSTQYSDSSSICQNGHYCLSSSFIAADLIPSVGNECWPKCEFNTEGGAGCYCHNFGLCSGKNYCTQLPDLTYECLPACLPNESSGSGCFCLNNGYCKGAEICEATGCQIYECETDADCVTENYFCYNFKCAHCSQMFPSCALCDSDGCWGVDSGNSSVRPPTPSECMPPQYYYADMPREKCIRCPDYYHVVQEECKSSLCTINSDCFSDEYYCDNLLCTECIHFPVKNCVKCDNSGCLQVDDGTGPREVQLADCEGPYYYNYEQSGVSSCRQCDNNNQFMFQNACVPITCETDADCIFDNLYCGDGLCKKCSEMMHNCSECTNQGCDKIGGAAVTEPKDCVQPLVFDNNKCKFCNVKQKYSNGECITTFPTVIVASGAAAAIIISICVILIVVCVKREHSKKKSQITPQQPENLVRMSEEVPSECATNFPNIAPEGSFARNSASVVSLTHTAPEAENPMNRHGTSLLDESRGELRNVASLATLERYSAAETEIDCEELVLKVPRSNLRRYCSQKQLEDYVFK